jgi:hypothetical protein
MRLVIFTVEEANHLLEELRPRIERLVKLKHELNRQQTETDVLALAASGASPDNPDAQELKRKQQRRTLLLEQISQGNTANQRRGCLIKDLDKGQVDFYALSGDRLVFLCWQLGEPEVSHWHTLEGGFAARQPLKHTESE